MKKHFTLIVLAGIILTAFSFKTDLITLTVDKENTKIKWTGYHLAKSYEHWGYVDVKSGDIDVKGNKIVSGTIVVDMTSLSNSDIEDAGKNKKLVRHLKSEDFFAVDKFPEAKIDIKKVSKGSGNTYKTTADLTIRGITKEIEFDTKITDISSSKLMAEASLRVPRTEFEVMYGWSIENAMLDGEFRLDVSLIASK